MHSLDDSQKTIEATKASLQTKLSPWQYKTYIEAYPMVVKDRRVILKVPSQQAEKDIQQAIGKVLSQHRLHVVIYPKVISI